MTSRHLSPDDVILSIEDLRTVFDTSDGELEVLKGVSFQIHRGEVLGVVGESGSGKSVTARSILGLVPVPGRVASGAIRFKGEDLTALSDREMQRIRGAEIALVLQEPMTSLNPVLTIGAQLREMFIYHPERSPKSGSIRQWIVSLLSKVRIPDAEDRVDQYPLTFSGGMRQRACIAMGVACNPDLLIADEPTTALDVTIQAQVLRLLLDLRDEFDVSILLITHDLGVVAEVCDTVAVMYAGQIVEYADIRTLFAEPRHPYTIALMKSLPRMDTGRLGYQPTIDGQPPDLWNLPEGCSFAPRCPSAMPRCSQEAPPAFPFDARGATGFVQCWLADPFAQEGAEAEPRSPWGRQDGGDQ